MPEIQNKLFINGEWVPGKAGRTFPAINPATEEKITDVHEADAEDVEIAYQAALKAFPEWRDQSMWHRVTLANKLADLIERDAAELAELEAKNMGLPVAFYPFCSGLAVSGIRHAAGAAHDIHGETSLNTPGFVTMTLRQPYGVCGAIIPWNVPIAMWCGKVIPAVLAGNTIVVKSSEKAPLTSLKLAALAAEAGFPPGVINVLSGFGPTAGNALATHMGIRRISFTGSTRAGKLVLEAAGKSNMKTVSLECGGKNPAVIFEDADLEAAATSISASMQFNSGQICISNSRVYVHKNILSKFAEIFKAKYTAVNAGDPTQPTTTMGPQVDEIQFNNILKLIDEAKCEGAEVLTGGSRSTEKGFFIQPTIFVQVPAKANLLKTEVFGPVVALQAFEDEEEIIKEANNTEYGLHASVFTKDISRAYKFVKAFEAGVVSVNCSSDAGAYDLPFGGWKQSSLGRESGKTGLETYFETKTVTIKL